MFKAFLDQNFGIIKTSQEIDYAPETVQQNVQDDSINSVLQLIGMKMIPQIDDIDTLNTYNIWSGRYDEITATISNITAIANDIDVMPKTIESQRIIDSLSGAIGELTVFSEIIGNFREATEIVRQEQNEIL